MYCSLRTYPSFLKFISNTPLSNNNVNNKNNNANRYPVTIVRRTYRGNDNDKDFDLDMDIDFSDSDAPSGKKNINKGFFNDDDLAQKKFTSKFNEAPTYLKDANKKFTFGSERGSGMGRQDQRSTYGRGGTSFGGGGGLGNFKNYGSSTAAYPKLNDFSRNNYGDDFGRNNYGDDFEIQQGNESNTTSYGSSDLSLDLKNWKSVQLVPKNPASYLPHPEVVALKPEDVSAWRKESGVVLRGDAPSPILKFHQAPFRPEVIKTLLKAYSYPTTIQSQGWPLALSGCDMVGSAATGSGKTLAFILPALEHIVAQQPLNTAKREGPLVLVLVPTRELAQQIEVETLRFAGVYGVRVACIFGGQGNKLFQTNQLKRFPQLVIATPGRIIDFMKQGGTNLDRTTYLVLDEADRMLDMGFEPQIRMIVGQMRADRQTLMWSATWPKKVQNLANEFFNKPVRLIIGSDELSANPNVTQKFIVCDAFERLKRLTAIISQQPTLKTLLFCSTKRQCDILGSSLMGTFKGQIRLAIMHGDKSQQQRNNIMSDFKRNVLHLVIATDVAARGLDVSDIERVINFEFPVTIETYIHRIGRTARGAKKGESLSFITPEDYPLVSALIQVLEKSSQPVPSEVMNILSQGGGRGPPARPSLQQQQQRNIFQFR